MSSHPMQDEVTVTQADREAALPILCHLYVKKGEEPALFIAEVKAGKYDDHYQIKAFARHRHQAERETLARMERFIEGFCKSLEMGDFANVEGALAERMCCNGQMCGCQGSTVGGYLAYELRSCFKDALPPAPEAG